MNDCPFDSLAGLFTRDAKINPNTDSPNHIHVLTKPEGKFGSFGEVAVVRKISDKDVEVERFNPDNPFQAIKTGRTEKEPTVEFSRYNDGNHFLDSNQTISLDAFNSAAKGMNYEFTIHSNRTTTNIAENLASMGRDHEHWYTSDQLHTDVEHTDAEHIRSLYPFLRESEHIAIAPKSYRAEITHGGFAGVGECCIFNEFGGGGCGPCGGKGASLTATPPAPPHVHMLTKTPSSDKPNGSVIIAQRVRGEGGSLLEPDFFKQEGREGIVKDRIEFVEFEPSKSVDTDNAIIRSGGGQFSQFNSASFFSEADFQEHVSTNHFTYESTLHTYRDVEDVSLTVLDRNGDGLHNVEQIIGHTQSSKWGDIAEHEYAVRAPNSYKADFGTGGLGECCIFNEFGGGGCGPCGGKGGSIDSSQYCPIEFNVI